MTLAQFKDKIKPSADNRAQAKVLEKQLLEVQDARDDADKESLATALLVVNAVRGDPAEGDDGALYEAMGYTRRSERSSGLHRGDPDTPPETPPPTT
jgi:hypothetical protein